jgi:mannitol/fructose-specific phosphotransferase system IIA component (Ntr-type)
VLAFALSLTFAGAAFTEWVGIHAIFGSFLVGVALGDSSHLREHTRAIIDRFVSFIFAPLFFASIGMKVNFIANFDPVISIVVLAIAAAGKIGGSAIGARVGGMRWKESLAVGAGMMSVGTMGIIIGLLALQYGIISERVFVALVFMAIVTSMISGPLMERVLKRRKPKRFTDFLSSRSFLPALKAESRERSIVELSNSLALPAGFEAASLAEAVWEREQLLATGLGNGIAVPHARVVGLQAPLIALGLSRQGIDFDAPDGEPAHIVFLLLTPGDDDAAQLEILADIARTFREEELRDRVREVGSYVEFLALMRSERKE